MNAPMGVQITIERDQSEFTRLSSSVTSLTSTSLRLAPCLGPLDKAYGTGERSRRPRPHRRPREKLGDQQGLSIPGGMCVIKGITSKGAPGHSGSDAMGTLTIAGVRRERRRRALDGQAHVPVP